MQVDLSSYPEWVRDRINSALNYMNGEVVAWYITRLSLSAREISDNRGHAYFLTENYIYDVNFSLTNIHMTRHCRSRITKASVNLSFKHNFNLDQEEETLTNFTINIDDQSLTFILPEKINNMKPLFEHFINQLK